MLASSEQQQQVSNATLRFFTTVSVEFIAVKIPFCVFFFSQTAAAVNVKLTATGIISNLYNLFPVFLSKSRCGSVFISSLRLGTVRVLNSGSFPLLKKVLPLVLFSLATCCCSL